MAEKRHSLHVIRDVLNDPIALKILGELSTDDLNTISKHLKAGTLHANISPILAPKAGQPKPAPDLKKVIAKLPPPQQKAVAKLYAARGPTCT